MNLRIEMLTDQHLCDQFSCGEEYPDVFLKKNAVHYQRKNIAKTYVITSEIADEGQGTVLGFYTLSVASVLPASVGVRWPNHPVPVALMGRLARDISQIKCGLGEILFADAAKRVIKISTFMGCYALVTDAKNTAAADFYKRFGMVSFPSQPLKLFITVETLRKALAENT
jgi:hypothetical protein